jgi:lycopene cyclase domain-containing protein
MDLYVLLNLAVLSIPLALSFDRRVAFFRRWPSVLLSIAIVGTVYLVWDVFATARGHWWFNDRFAGSLRIAGLPMGEILFFIMVPYSCLFLFEVIGAYWADKVLVIPRALWLVPVAVLIGAAFWYRSQPYTFLALLSAALFLLAALPTRLLFRRQFWLYMVISAAAFLLSNGLLTSLPVVGYNEAAIWGIRVYTIPLEDFAYCFSLLGFNVLLHTLLRQRLSLRRKRS